MVVIKNCVGRTTHYRGELSDWVIEDRYCPARMYIRTCWDVYLAGQVVIQDLAHAAYGRANKCQATSTPPACLQASGPTRDLARTLLPGSDDLGSHAPITAGNLAVPNLAVLWAHMHPLYSYKHSGAAQQLHAAVLDQYSVRCASAWRASKWTRKFLAHT